MTADFALRFHPIWGQPFSISLYSPYQGTEAAERLSPVFAGNGVMNEESVDQAKGPIQALPLAAKGSFRFEFIPVGPLKPLDLLIQGK
jgi:hypothetical protein